MNSAQILAEEATRIRMVYLSMGKDAPNTLADNPNKESMVGLLALASQALKEECCTVTIHGRRSMAYITAFFQFLCPNDLEITVENIIIHPGERRNIRVGIVQDWSAATSMTLQTLLQTSSNQGDPVTIPVSNNYPRMIVFLSYSWNGWLTT